MTAYASDSLGRIDMEKYYASAAEYSAGNVAEQLDYVYDIYDSLGRHEQIIDASGARDMLYDDRGRLIVNRLAQ